MDRRRFIKISSTFLGGLAFTAPLLSNSIGNMIVPNPESRISGLRTPTYCEVCFWKCAGWVEHDESGNIKKIIGNDEDQHSNGRFCPRGTGGVGMYNDGDRLKNPLIRTTINGKQEYREASWEEALNYIADKLKAISEKYGPDCIALLTHGSGGSYFGNLLKAIGSRNIAAPSYAQCRGPREVAFIGTFGEGIGSPERTDIRDTRCLVLIGSHIGENMHNGHVQEMSDAIDKGAQIITVDPRFSTAASKSNFWLPIKPATDMALLLAWIHEIIYNEMYDKKYVDKYTFGFDQLKEHVKDMTPEWAYGITTIKPDQIRETARAMANASPSVIIHPGRHVTWYGDDTQRLRAVAILNALLGSWGRRGGFYNPEKAYLPKYKLPEYPKSTRSWRDAFPGQFKLADLALASGICDATIPSVDDKCSFKAWIVNGTNLITTLPDQKNTLKAIQSLELLVVVDTMPMEITGYADVVLPECTYLERYDSIRVSGHRNPQIALRMPAAEPKYNSKSAWWMARELGLKMGLGAYFPFKTQEEELDWQLKNMDSSLEEMKRIGVKTFPREFDDLYIDENDNFEFNTNTGKIELYSTSFEEEGHSPLPVYTAHDEPPEGFYRLNYGRAPMHTFGRTSNNPNLADLMDENSVWVNPKVARDWDLKNNQYIWLENQDGIRSSFPIKVRVTERIRFDSVYMVHGFGHDSKKLTQAHGRGASDSELISKVLLDPIMGGTGMRGNFVTFKFKAANMEKNT
ncbi:MAG: molybdopterin-dependent oxidoreductase [Candidatus Marinimicrobia bacterium]|nr:molybdopterin-dependent oxidoreductase [Candidatus Neomarinimicrobiota bacterium]MBT3634336.1 molybdopterin-dependent oxidoreductase [Candidatus Neomarinimicrobiota bacterium]MBT3681755.1 molybdopterin-dependent oxidoreductase [Candidatus Neomarinimicrobiota bacterium]MBT3759481.1 molybdopterin-dependent oxidoreductase [Candidatus Neomarinimicrobiota bacterium]MBT3895969.1 molybdopterin-dependent oxidoreductase [Candidatus Neomarinimicrobiota bacterium]